MAFPTEAPLVRVYAGDDAELVRYQLFQADGVTPRDLTGYTNWIAQWRTSADSTTFLPLTVDTTNLAIGKFVVAAPNTTTAAMTGDGVWDVEATGPEGIRTFVFGRTSLRRDVTRV